MMEKKLTKTIILFYYLTITFLFCSCSKSISKNNLDIVLIGQTDLCPSGKASQDIIKIYTPIDVEHSDSILSLEGRIIQLTNSLKNSVSISDDSSAWYIRMRRSILKKEKYDAFLENYKNIMTSLSFSPLCTTNAMNSDDSLKNFIKNNQYDYIYVYSKTIKSSTWNNFGVYNNADSLHNIIATNVLQGKNNFLVIYEPSENDSGTSTTLPTTPTKVDSPKIVIEPGIDQALKQKVHEALIRISNPHNSESERFNNVDESMKYLFSKDFDVIMHDDDPRDLGRTWDRGFGIDYLKRLAVDDSIIGFDILKVETNTTDKKVRHIEIVEKHNK